MNQPGLIVIDDEADMAGFISEVAEQAGFDVRQFNSAEVFKEQYDTHVDVIVLDLMMPGVDGIEVIRFLSRTGCDAHLILISGFDPGVLHSAQKLAKEQGLNFYGSLSKPFRYDELHQLLSGLSITPKSSERQLPVEPPSVDELREALANDELVVYYQPKVGLNSGRVTAVEALVRWQRPNVGLVGPDSFIATAEQHGLIDDLTWVVLEQAMAQCRLWHDQGVRMQVSVNMSASTLKELDLPERMDGLAQKYCIDTPQVVLEVTETALMSELTKSLDILTRLRMKGFQLSIDDFGTGYSSLVQLYRVPFSEIKIDLSFVMEMENDPEASAIVETIILLGHKLDMKIVAEGVETDSCRERLADLDCDQAQGYLFARPMPCDAVIPWFSQHNAL